MKAFFRSMSQCTVYSNVKDLFEYTKFYFTCIKNNFCIGIPWREENLKFFQLLTSCSLSIVEDCRLVATLKECTFFATFALPVTLSLLKKMPSTPTN